jgi:hypothetical protein
LNRRESNVRKLRIQLIVFAGLLAGMSLGAQAAGPGGPFSQQGFSSQLLVSQLSLYLPEEATRGMYRGFGGRANAPSAAGQNAPSAQGGQNAPAGQAQGGGSAGGFPQLQFTRDPKLYLTKEQITGLIPILIALRDNPLPTPSKAKQVQADVDAQLTAAQKAEWAEFQKKLQDLIAQFRQRMGANSAAGQGSTNGAGVQRQDQLQDGQNAPSAQGGQGGGQAGGGPQPTLLQRRQRQLDAFIKVLQDRLKLASA